MFSSNMTSPVTSFEYLHIFSNELVLELLPMFIYSWLTMSSNWKISIRIERCPPSISWWRLDHLYVLKQIQSHLYSSRHFFKPHSILIISSTYYIVKISTGTNTSPFYHNLVFSRVGFLPSEFINSGNMTSIRVCSASIFNLLLSIEFVNGNSWMLDGWYWIEVYKRKKNHLKFLPTSHPAWFKNVGWNVLLNSKFDNVKIFYCQSSVIPSCIILFIRNGTST